MILCLLLPAFSPYTGHYQSSHPYFTRFSRSTWYGHEFFKQDSLFKRLVLQTRKNQGLFGKGFAILKSITTLLRRYITYSNIQRTMPINVTVVAVPLFTSGLALPCLTKQTLLSQSGTVNVKKP